MGRASERSALPTPDPHADLGGWGSARLVHRSGFGATGTFVAIAIAEAAIAVIGVLVFRRGGWKNHTV